MAADNQGQIEEWNAEMGRRWAENQDRLDRLLAAFGAAALDASDAAAGERVIDVGCGCGDTTLALAARVGAAGDVLGVDVSAPMLARARARAEGLANVRFVEADASIAALPGGRDLLYSRFGVMFFAAPAAAFAHLHGALRPGGRLAFVCWRPLMENPWMVAPVAAAMTALGITPTPSDPHAPGPFAFGDAARVRGILGDAGFADVMIAPFDAPLRLGDNAAEAARQSAEVGPLGRLLREAGEGAAPVAIRAVTEALRPFETPDGVLLGGATWIVTARA